jgi:hypothetical protein
MSGKQNLTAEDYLRRHLESLESKPSSPTVVTSPLISNKPEGQKSNDLHFFSFDIEEFPCSIFYPTGTLIQVRAAMVKEIQAYSMVDDNNPYDIIEKMNDILSSCVKIKYPNGQIGSYLELSDPDRLYCIFLIRELTFQKGTTLTTNVNCDCGKEVTIELVRQNFKNYDIDSKLGEYFDPETATFKFELTNGKTYHLCPPTISVRKAFTDYAIKENIEKRKPNLSFIKIFPFLLYDNPLINSDQLKLKLEEFNKMDDVSFQFLNQAVEKLNFGIEKLVKNCECGLEIHTEMTFPDGPSAIFIVHDAFDKFIKK